jgi:hypothetical protein
MKKNKGRLGTEGTILGEGASMGRRALQERCLKK